MPAARGKATMTAPEPAPAREPSEAAAPKTIATSRLRDSVHAGRERIRVAREGSSHVDDDDVAGGVDGGEDRDENFAVPYGLRVSAAWGWRLLVLAGAGYVLLWLVGRLAAVIIPLVIALLLSAMLAPAVRILRTKLRLPAALATAIVLIGGLLTVA